MQAPKQLYSSGNDGRCGAYHTLLLGCNSGVWRCVSIQFPCPKGFCEPKTAENRDICSSFTNSISQERKEEEPSQASVGGWARPPPPLLHLFLQRQQWQQQQRTSVCTVFPAPQYACTSACTRKCTSAGRARLHVTCISGCLPGP